MKIFVLYGLVYDEDFWCAFDVSSKGILNIWEMSHSSRELICEGI